jgi:hypothetical protein
VEIVNARGEACPPARFDAGGALVNAEEAIGKPSLRRLLWHGDDPVYELSGQGYGLMTDDREDALEAEFARHGRD